MCTFLKPSNHLPFQSTRSKSLWSTGPVLQKCTPMNLPMSPDRIRTLIQNRDLDPSMEISLTETASRAVLTLKTDHFESNKCYLRVYIDGKGCDGFYYGVTFDSKSPTDFVFDASTIQIIVDPKSLYFIYGSIIDWVSDERGTGFIVNNPNHDRYRGKFYKKKAWTQALEPS